MLVYSSNLRRAFKSIVYSLKEILQLFIFFILICLFFAVIGKNIIGDMEEEVVYDELS